MSLMNSLVAERNKLLTELSTEYDEAMKNLNTLKSSMFQLEKALTEGHEKTINRIDEFFDVPGKTTAPPEKTEQQATFEVVQDK